MTEWLENAPEWLAALTHATDSKWQWLSQSASETISMTLQEAARDGSFGYALSPPLVERCEPVAKRCVPLALGPNRRDAYVELDHVAVLLFDPERPETPLLALDETFPALLWIACSPDLSGLEATQATYWSSGLPVPAYNARSRAFVGTAEMLQSDWLEVERHLAVNGATTGLPWGSAYDDDPWPSTVPEGTSQLDLVALTREHMRQHPERTPRTSFRTRWSRSVLTIEEHGGIWVIETRYEPTRHQSPIAELNQAFGVTYPEDMPVDAVAALFGFFFEPADLVREALASNDAHEVGSPDFNLAALGAVSENVLLCADDVRALARSADPHRNLAAANVSLQNGWEFLLYEMLETENDELTRQDIVGALLGTHVDCECHE